MTQDKDAIITSLTIEMDTMARKLRGLAAITRQGRVCCLSEGMDTLFSSFANELEDAIAALPQKMDRG